MTRYLLIVIIGLLMALFIMYSIYDSTKEELSKVKNEKFLLQKEIERRNTNAENLAKHIKDLEKSLEKNRDWADTPIPNNIIDSLQK